MKLFTVRKLKESKYIRHQGRREQARRLKAIISGKITLSLDQVRPEADVIADYLKAKV